MRNLVQLKHSAPLPHSKTGIPFPEIDFLHPHPKEAAEALRIVLNEAKFQLNSTFQAKIPSKLPSSVVPLCPLAVLPNVRH